MAEIRVNATGGLKLFDADDSHYAQIIAGTITSNTDVMTLGHNVIDIPMTTASSSATTWALTIGGGLGVAADLYIGDDTYLITDSAVLGFGADKDTTLTHTDGTGLTLNSTNKLCFNDATQFIQGISGTVLGLGATDEIDLTATAIDINGTADVSGAFTAGSTIVATGSVTGTTIEPNADTSAGDNAAIGYTSGEGLILTGQGSTSDVTLKNDADGTVFTVPTGTDDILFPDSARAMWGAGSDLQIYHNGTDSFIADSSSSDGLILKSQTIRLRGSNDEGMITCGENGTVDLLYDNALKLRTASGGVTITGAISKDSGSFRIKHPLESKKNTHNLVHSFVESPRADLIYRGKATLSSGSATVNIDTAAGMSEGTFVALCDDVQCFTTNESNWDLVKASVSGNTLTLESQNSESTAEISWLVLGDRKDEHIMTTDWTDENGKPIIEPLQPE